ncbi:MAG: GNAT family N-acetyltransferase [Candidatus Entotheonellia bacterium]
MLSIIRDKSQWDALYATLHRPSIVASHGYVNAAAQLENSGRAELAVWSGDDRIVFHPYIRRQIDGESELDDLVSAWEFGGFWFDTDHQDHQVELLQTFSKAFFQRCADEKIVSEVVRLYPFAPFVATSINPYHIRYYSEHIIIPLTEPYETLWQAFPSSLRGKIRQAERHRLSARPSEDINTFARVYHQNLDRLGAEPFYYFPAAFLQAIQAHIQLLFVFDHRDRVCAAHCYLEDGGVYFAFLCHGVQEALDLRPNDFAYNAAVQEAQKRRFRFLHMGGGGPSLMAYKRKFSRMTRPFYIGRCIFRPDIYAALVAQRQQRLGIDLTKSSHFPVYRTLA